MCIERERYIHQAGQSSHCASEVQVATMERLRMGRGRDHMGESSAVQHFTRPSASLPALGKKLGSNLDCKSEPQSKHITADMKLEDTKLMFPNEKLYINLVVL